VGYYVKDLLQDIKRILGLNKEWRMAVMGIGNLGSALLSYKDFLSRIIRLLLPLISIPKSDWQGFGKGGKTCRDSPYQPQRGLEGEKDRDWTHHHPLRSPECGQSIGRGRGERILNFAPAQVTVLGIYGEGRLFTNILDNLAYLLSNN
jgi:redox-sensing transcriptional repressor